MGPELDNTQRERLAEIAKITGKTYDEVLALVTSLVASTAVDVAYFLLTGKEPGQSKVAPARHTEEQRKEQDLAWAKFLALAEKVSARLPPNHVVDDSRDSIYSGRGE